MDIGKPRLILKDLRADLKAVAQMKASGAQRGAYAAAAVKRFKSRHYLQWLRKLEKAERLDMTPRLAVRLCGELFDRKPSTNEIQIIWQNSDRICTHHSPDFSRVADLVETYGAQAKLYRREIEVKAAELVAATK